MASKLLTLLLATRTLAFPHLRRQEPTCDLADLSSVTLPSSTLPSPAGLTLSSIVIGRGVQNYTCDNATAAPAAIGAVAVLYDASCIAISDNAVFGSLVDTALTLELPADANGDLVCDQTPLKRTGHHFFNAAKTPVFDLSEGNGGALGVGLMKVNNRSPAPNTADVAWLELGFVDGTQGPIQAIYRVQTRGGQPPATCEGVDGSVISEQYSTEYWVFTGPTNDDEEPDDDEPPVSSTTTSAGSTPTPTSVPSTPLEPAQPNRPPPPPAPGAGGPRPPPPAPPAGGPGGPPLPPRGPPALPTRPVGGVITRPSPPPRPRGVEAGVAVTIRA